jgi:hypothetical protein
VVICVQKAGHPVITSDPDDLRRLDPGVRVVAIRAVVAKLLSTNAPFPPLTFLARQL